LAPLFFRGMVCVRAGRSVISKISCNRYMHVAHITSVHTRHDTRIFHKMCKSGAAHDIRMVLVVADGKGDSVKAGVSIHDVGKSKGRIDRMWGASRRVFEAALTLNADIYHLHDPELMPIGLKLKSLGKRVVFDAHEDLPKQLLGKPYLRKPTRRILSCLLARYEAYACKHFDGVIAATPFIRDKFLRINPNTVDINNFPLLHEMVAQTQWANKNAEICYVGGISKIRGIIEVCESMSLTKSSVRLNLVGMFAEPKTEEAAKALPGWRLVNEWGQLSREDVRAVLGRSIAGLVTFHPLPNHVDAQPNKMFEYMSAGIPVVASDFPLWRQIIEGTDCGLLVDPLKPAKIAVAIDELASNPDRARHMGKNGRVAVEQRYNWGIEEQKLLNFYNDILGARRN
jgi:glycosyltransferase involved in cell wall biosynthesis